MQHKHGRISIIIAFGALIFVIIAVIIVSLFKHTFNRRIYEKNFLAPFHEIYDVLCEEYSFITSFHEELGEGEYAMYYIECDIAENIDCFAELVDLQREINAFMETKKDDEWFDRFCGHIEISAGCQSLRFFYHNGSMSNEIWANDVVSDDYGVLWDAFPKNDEIYLVLSLTNYSDEIKSEIAQKYEGKNIKVKQQHEKYN